MKDDKLYLIHISESIQRIEEYIQNGREFFLANIMAQDAVLRNFEGLEYHRPQFAGP